MFPCHKSLTQKIPICVHYLMALVEKEAEVSEDHPQLLPAVAVLELPQQEPTQLVLFGPEKSKQSLYSLNIL